MLEQADRQQEGQRREKASPKRRLAELRKMVRNVACATGDGSAAAVADELRKLNEECVSVETRLGELAAHGDEERANVPAEQDVAEALRNIDPLWDGLFPAEQERIVRLLVEGIIVTTGGIDIRFRTNGIEQIVEELQPIEERVHA